MPRVRLQTSSSSSASPPVVPVESRPASSESNEESNHDSNRFDHSNHDTHNSTIHGLTQDDNDNNNQDSMEWDFDFESSTPSTAVVWHSMSSSSPSPPAEFSSSPNKHYEIKSILKIHDKKDVSSKWTTLWPVSSNHRKDSQTTNNKEHKMVQFQKDVQFRQKQKCNKKPKYDNHDDDHYPSRNHHGNNVTATIHSKRAPRTIRRRGTNFDMRSSNTRSSSSTRSRSNNTIRTTIPPPMTNDLLVHHDMNSIPEDAKDVQKCNHGSPKHVMMTPTTSCTVRDHGTIVTPTTVTAHATHSTTNPTVRTRSLFAQRGIGIDTRYIQRFAGDAISQRFRNLVYEFLYTCADSGLLPSILSSTAMSCDTHPTTATSSSSSTSSSTSTSTRFHILCKGTRLYFHMLSKEQMMDVILPPVSIPVCETTMDEIENHATTTSFTCPPELKATESWNRLEDLVNSILTETSKGSNSHPMDITIVTNDAAFFIDTDIDSHKSGTCHFWNRMRSRFNTNQIKSIHIVCFCIGVDVLSLDDDFDPTILSVSSTASYSSSIESLESSIMKPSTSSSDQKCKISNRFQVHICAQAIVKELASLSMQELSTSHHDTNNHRQVSKNPMDITFSFHNCHMIQFENLLRKWTHDSFSTFCPKGRISFDLPETHDGTQCSVTLDLSYQMLPFQMNSLATDALVEDMKMISNSTFSVIQLVPLDQVDLSLIYGVPFVAQAGLEGDIEQYKEIQRVYNELLKYLLERDYGLVLCSETNDRMGVFSDKPEKNLYLLMARESDVDVEKSRDTLLRGTLHRYCRRSSQILEPVSMTNSVISYDGSNIDVYSEIVKNALEFIPTSVINPSTLSSTETF